MAAIKYLNSLDRIQIISPRDPTGTYLLIFCRFRRFFRSWQHVNSSCPVPAWGGGPRSFPLFLLPLTSLLVRVESRNSQRRNGCVKPVQFQRLPISTSTLASAYQPTTMLVFRSLRYPSHTPLLRISPILFPHLSFSHPASSGHHHSMTQYNINTFILPSNTPTNVGFVSGLSNRTLSGDHFFSCPKYQRRNRSSNRS